MLFPGSSHDIGKELKRMKRLLRALCTCLAALLIGWYCVPQVYRVLHLPEHAEIAKEWRAPALWIDEETARPASESGDERLGNGSIRISLFGLIPVKTVSSCVLPNTVRLGGQAIGVILKTEGVQIVGFEKIPTARGTVCPAISAGLREGDMICAVNGTEVADADAFSALCAEADRCVLSCLRDGEPFSVTVIPETDDDGTKRIGAWVRDSTSGIGTMSFYDPETRTYAALGHGVTDVDTQKLISPAAGFLTEARITKIRKGDGNTAGELIGDFSVRPENSIATVERNTPFGISGKLGTFHDANARAVSIAPSSAAHKGDAYILSTIDGTVTAYSVKVIRVDMQSSPETRGMMIEINDPVLLEKTGGIVQGMSGSPLIQDGRLIGVVTHVFLSRPTRGYCLYAEWMADALLQNR